MENVDILFTELNIPLIYVAVYIGLITIAALFSRIRFLLVVSYIFVLYIGYFHNRILIQETLEGTPAYIGLYFASGVIILILALVALFKES